MIHAFVISPRQEVITAFKSQGIRATKVIEKSETQSQRKDGDIIVVDDASNPLQIVDALLGCGVTMQDPDVVCVGLGDLSCLTASAVNNLLEIGNDNYATVSSLLYMKHKPKLRELLAEKLPEFTGKFEVVRDLDSLYDAILRLSCEVVIKPLASSGSRNVFCVRRQNDLDVVASRISFPVLVEELFTGSEYSVEVVTIRGTHQPLAVTEKILGGESGVVEIGQVQPANIDNPTKELLFDTTCQLLDTVDFGFGLSHTEIILQNRIPKIVETHGRVGGDRIADLLGYTTGHNAFERLGHAISTGEFLPIEPKALSGRIDFIDLRDYQGTDQEWLAESNAKQNTVEAKVLKPKENRGEVWCSSDRHAFILSIYGSED